MRILFSIVAVLLLLVGLLEPSIPLIGIGMTGIAFLILTKQRG